MQNFRERPTQRFRESLKCIPSAGGIIMSQPSFTDRGLSSVLPLLLGPQKSDRLAWVKDYLNLGKDEESIFPHMLSCINSKENIANLDHLPRSCDKCLISWQSVQLSMVTSVESLHWILILEQIIRGVLEHLMEYCYLQHLPGGTHLFSPSFLWKRNNKVSCCCL